MAISKRRAHCAPPLIADVRSQATIRDIYWVRDLDNIRLAIMPRPRSGEWLGDEVAGWRAEGLDAVVSMLELSEVEELGLSSEGDLCNANGIQFFSYPVPDRGVPPTHESVTPLVRTLVSHLQSNQAVGIHCRAGIGRSALLAACVLSELGVAPDAAFPMLSRARGVAVPDTDDQFAWVMKYAKSMELGI